MIVYSPDLSSCTGVGEAGREKFSETSFSFVFRASPGRGIGLPADNHPLSPFLEDEDGGSLIKGLRHFLGASREI